MPTVQLFVTCLVDTFFPNVGEASVRLLQQCGVRVEFPPDQTCCAQPMFNAGLREQARQVADHTMHVFGKVQGDIVTPSGSCAHMIRHNYAELFEGDASKRREAEALAGRTYELTEYLVDVLGIVDFQAEWPGPLAYHPTCHLHRGLKVERAPRVLLEHVRGAELRELPEAEDCCGFGGVFSVEQPELARELLQRKIRNLQASQAATLVVCDTGCLMHLQGGLRRAGANESVVHIAEVLASTSTRGAVATRDADGRG